MTCMRAQLGKGREGCDLGLAETRAWSIAGSRDFTKAQLGPAMAGLGPGMGSRCLSRAAKCREGAGAQAASLLLRVNFPTCTSQCLHCPMSYLGVGGAKQALLAFMFYGQGN